MNQPSLTASRLDGLVTGIRAALNRRGDWQHPARRAASALRRHLPSPEALTGAHPSDHQDLRSRLLRPSRQAVSGRAATAGQRTITATDGRRRQ